MNDPCPACNDTRRLPFYGRIMDCPVCGNDVSMSILEIEDHGDCATIWYAFDGDALQVHEVDMLITSILNCQTFTSFPAALISVDTKTWFMRRGEARFFTLSQAG